MADNAPITGHAPESEKRLRSKEATKDSDGMTVEFDETEERYLIREGHFECWYEKGPKPLCNFVARIEEEAIYDDGVETTRTFVIEGQTDTGEMLPAVSVDAGQFQRLNWVQEKWGAKAVVTAGYVMRDKLREAIQRVSKNPRQRRVFTHTGWRAINGRWVYLTGSGAIGDTNAEVLLAQDLHRLRLPVAPVDLETAVKASLALLEVAPLTVMAPILGAVYRAPLCELLPCDASVFLEGLTGTFKSSLAALAQSHWGRYDHTNLPGSWSSTDNHLERRAFTLKDVLFVVDDYALSPHNRKEMESKASRVLRAQGNLSGRGRLRADGSECATLHPRGIILGTGEQRPSTERSIVARMLVVEIDKGDVCVFRPILNADSGGT